METIGVGALIFKDNKVLLTYRTPEAGFYSGCWFIPCGTVEPGEDPLAAIVRELGEELGVEASVRRELFVRQHPSGLYERVYECDIVGSPQLLDKAELGKLGYFLLDALPPKTHLLVHEMIQAYEPK